MKRGRKRETHPKAKEIKTEINKWDLIKVESFYTVQ